MSQVSLEENKLKELIKSALRDVLEERDDMLNEALEAALDDVGPPLDAADGLPDAPLDADELEDLSEQMDWLLNDLADSARLYLDTLDRLRTTPPESDAYGGLAGELHEAVVRLEEGAQDTHDTMHELMDLDVDDLDFDDEDEAGRSGLN